MDNNRFLYRIAKHIFGKEETSFENTLVVLPNKRAIRFLYEYIPNEDKQTCFVPDIFSIDEIVKKNVVEFSLADKLPLLYTLHKSYCKIYYKYNPTDKQEKQESFADFYFWGGVLLNDFDELDKNLVNVKSFYRNIEEYKKLEASADEILTEEQKELLSKFFNINFANDNGVIENFVKIWNCLYEIYEDFNLSLRQQKMAYSGMIYREFVAKLKNQEIILPYKYIHIAGFSVLNQCEKMIFSLLKEQYSAEFYWDFDFYYKNNKMNEAGIFMRENFSLFPMSESFSENNFNQIEQHTGQEINIVKASYSSYSLTYIKQWLEEIDYKQQNPSDIAIILLDESLAPLVLKSLPKDIQVNITMGYPFKQTLLYNDIISLLSKWVKQGLDKQTIDNDIRTLAQEILDSGEKDRFWQLDILKSINESMLSFVDSLDFFDRKDLTEDVLTDVLKKYLNRENIDLVSDAINGIQVMGLLESRALDFEYVLMLSCSDENLPKVSSDSSFIPFSFKEAYNMMSIKRKVGLFAYYFYRLFHTPMRMDFVYTTASSEKMQEMSRFLRQIKIEMAKFKQIKEITLQTSVPYILESKEYIFDINDLGFMDNGTKALSASALNKLIDCEKKFYLSVIRGLYEEIKDEDYIRIAFGNVFHSIANEYYELRNADKNASKEDLIAKVMQQSRINQYDETTQKRQYDDKQKNLNCLEDLHFLMLEKYLRDVIEMDEKQQNVYLYGELPLEHCIEIDGHRIHFKSRLDRLDRDKYGNYRIVDYKTGKKNKEGIGDLVDVFNKDYDNRKLRTGRADYVFEILFYCWLVYNQPKKQSVLLHNIGGKTLQPVLLYLSNVEDNAILIGKRDDKTTMIYDEEMNKNFENELKILVSSLINKRNGEKYQKTPDTNACKNCDFALLCNR